MASRGIAGGLGACFAIGAVIAACGSSVVAGAGGGTSTGSTATKTADAALTKACGDYAKALCARRDACTNGFAIPTQYGDAAACAARVGGECAAIAVLDGAGSTAAGVASCAAAIPAWTCDDLRNNTPPAACIPQAGALAEGKPCVAHAQCASTYCAIPLGTLCGACAPLPVVGDYCDETGECGRSLACTRSYQVCVAPLGEGGSCDREHPCKAGLSCVGSGNGILGTCKLAGTKVGDACDGSRSTAADCDRTLGLSCDSATKLCKATALVEAGQPCGNLTAGAAACKAGATCVGMQGTQGSGTCAAAAADGQACDTRRGPGCTSPATCIITPPSATDAGVGDGGAGDAGAPTSTTAGTCQRAASAVCK